jgi:hypothetical protein
MSRRRLFPIALIVFALACGEGEEKWLAPETAARGAPSVAVQSATVDSVLPMEVMLARFREGLSEPAVLEHGAITRNALVDGIMTALQASDTAAFEALAVDRAEFAWLYFPSASIARPPYELPPGLAWFRLQEGNRKGVFRALRELEGRPLALYGHRCEPEPVVEGQNRIWVGCAVHLARASGQPVSLRLFESILERDGRFAVLSFANDF